MQGGGEVRRRGEHRSSGRKAGLGEPSVPDQGVSIRSFYPWGGPSGAVEKGHFREIGLWKWQAN